LSFCDGTGTGKLDALFTAPSEQNGIDKLAAIITVYIRKGKREVRFYVQQGLENLSVGFVERWA
jgi:hypothetical protein